MQRALMLMLAGAIAALAFADPAEAHGRRGGARIGVFVGGPIWWGWHHHYPRYERVIVERPGPTVYVEKNADDEALDADQYWYFCPDSKTYYPYVKQCSSPWQRVEPTPPQ